MTQDEINKFNGLQGTSSLFAGTVSKDGNILYPDNGYMYGPYDSMGEALTLINAAIGSEVIPVGFTFGVKDSTGDIMEYWLDKPLASSKTTLEAGDFVPKTFKITDNGFKVGDYTFVVETALIKNT